MCLFLGREHVASFRLGEAPVLRGIVCPGSRGSDTGWITDTISCIACRNALLDLFAVLSYPCFVGFYLKKKKIWLRTHCTLIMFLHVPSTESHAACSLTVPGKSKCHILSPCLLRLGFQDTEKEWCSTQNFLSQEERNGALFSLPPSVFLQFTQVTSTWEPLLVNTEISVELITSHKG